MDWCRERSFGHWATYHKISICIYEANEKPKYIWKSHTIVGIYISLSIYLLWFLFIFLFKLFYFQNFKGPCEEVQGMWEK